MSPQYAHAASAAAPSCDGDAAEHALRRRRLGRLLLGLGGLLERAVEQPLGPRELEREERQADRDDDERRPGQDEHRDAAEQQREAGDDERGPDDARALVVALALGLESLDDLRSRARLGRRLGLGGHTGKLQRDVAVLALRARLALGQQRLERGDDLRPRLVRDDHVVDVAALGRRVRVGEARLVVVDELLRGARPASASSRGPCGR